VLPPSDSTRAVAATEKVQAKEKVIQGFEKEPVAADVSKNGSRFPTARSAWAWPVSESAGSLLRSDSNDTQNVEIVAVTDIVPDRCAALAEKVGCKKTYPSAEEMVKDDKIEAVFHRHGRPSHARLCIEALKHGKHAASAVPAVFGSLEEADQLFEMVKKSGLKYMLFETSYFHAGVHAMREIHKAGGSARFFIRKESISLHAGAAGFLQRLAHWLAAAILPHSLQRLLHRGDRRKFCRGFLHGHAEHLRPFEAGEQSLQKPVW